MEPPSKPLKILTINGGGLQAISTLLILDELLGAIAKTNGVRQRKPRPCDVFDTIGKPPALDDYKAIFEESLYLFSRRW